MKVCQITNIPAPYRERVHELINIKLGGNYHVIYANKVEQNRVWKFELGEYDYTFLNSQSVKHKYGEVHFSLSILKELKRIDPDIIIISGLGPVQLLAFCWAKVNAKRLIALSDSNLFCERNFSILHRLLRKIVYRFVDGFIGASQKTKELFHHYSKIGNRPFRLSPLSIDESRFVYDRSLVVKKYDLLFAGQFIKGKNPLFFISVAKKVQELIGRKIRVAMLGSGGLESEAKQLLDEFDIDYDLPGFVQQDDLPTWYIQSNIFLFPSSRDAWGLVANEACAAGLPVIVSPHAGVANELVVEGVNGYVLDLDVDLWANKVVDLLSSEDLYKRFSNNAIKQVMYYTQEKAALELVDCCTKVNSYG